MKKRQYLYGFAAGLLGLSLFAGCAEDALTGAGGQAEGLTLDLTVSGQPVMSATTRAASDATLNETLVKTVDVFFYEAGSDQLFRHVRATADAQGKATLATGTWKDIYSAQSYDVYVLANLHTCDNPVTPAVESDLSWVKDKDDMLSLADTDVNVARAQGEQMGQGEPYADKDFLMDGKVTAWNAAAQAANATIPVDLHHAAAKIRVNVSYTEDFLVEGREIISVSKKPVHYVQDVRAFADGAELTMTDLQGEAVTDGFSLANVTTGEGTGRTDVLYAYTYPNEWGSDIATRETYILLNIPFGDADGTSFTGNYYKVPVRVSSNAADLRLDRNTEYTVNVTVNRVGNEELDEPVTLNPQCTIAPWRTENIDVDGQTPNYLVVSENYIELHNETDTVVTFFSSDYINVEVTEAYYVNKYGAEVDIDKTQIVPTYNPQSLTGEIKISSPVPTNVTARYIILQVTNGVSDPQTIEIVQYPLEYISGVPGVYATRSDLEATGNTYENYVNGTTLTSQPSVSASVFDSKVYENGIYYVGYDRENVGSWRDPIYEYTLTTDGFDYSHDNNRMYLVQITSTSGEHTVARPAMEGTGEDIVTKSNDENNRLVSPMFMLASQLGTVLTGNWSTAQEHCKQYVEVAKYPDGTIRRFADWRLPTFEELKVIAQYQYTQGEVMDEVLAGARYWSAHENRYLERDKYTEENPSVGSTGGWGGGTTCYIRCIRDVSPEDLEEFRSHGIR